MSGDQGAPVNDPHRVDHGLQWPITILGVALLGAIVAITVTGHDVSGLQGTIALLLSTVSAGGTLGAWVNSRQAVKQTNGALDVRLATAFDEGIARHIGTLQAAVAPQDFPSRAPSSALETANLAADEPGAVAGD